MVILQAEMDPLTPKTYEKTYNMPVVISFIITLYIFCSTVQYGIKMVILSSELISQPEKSNKRQIS